MTLILLAHQAWKRVNTNAEPLSMMKPVLRVWTIAKRVAPNESPLLAQQHHAWKPALVDHPVSVVCVCVRLCTCVDLCVYSDGAERLELLREPERTSIDRFSIDR